MHARITKNIQRLSPRSTSPRRRPRRSERSAVQSVSPPATEPSDPEARVREAGGPQDSACYTCSCGMVFQAPVSTSVSCPHCGTDQAW
jgi:hypothetical protein